MVERETARGPGNSALKK